LNNKEIDIEKLIDNLKKQDDFIIEIFNDNRIDDAIKNEYAEKYNLLKIQRID